MAITAIQPEGTKREQVPSGGHVARCYSIIDIGTLQTPFQELDQHQQPVFDHNGAPVYKKAHKVRIGFELPHETRVFSEEKGEQPMVISNEYTLSLHEKAKLREHLESWRGKQFTEDELKGFDVSKLLGLPAYLNVIHNDKGYANVAGIMPVPQGMNVPEQVNQSVLLDFEENWNKDTFESLPEFLRDKISQSEEYKSKYGPSPEDRAAQAEEHAQQNITSEDIPF